MISKFRVILDSEEEDVFRDIEITSSSSLVDLNDAIKNAFLLEGDELSAFYLSDDDWTQGEEILLAALDDESGEARTMGLLSVEEIINKESKRLLYVYDFLSLWTFFVEWISERDGELEFPATVFEYGEKPEKAPEKNMEDAGEGADGLMDFFENIAGEGSDNGLETESDLDFDDIY